MSTAYRIVGRGRRLSETNLRQMATQEGMSVEKDSRGDIGVGDPTRRVWFYRSPKGTYNTFERFGTNDPTSVLDMLEVQGYEWLSEHDDGFWK